MIIYTFRHNLSIIESAWNSIQCHIYIMYPLTIIIIQI